MLSEIRKTIIPAAGLGTRFLPISKAVSKELLPLVDRPMAQYVVEEAKRAGLNQVVFVVPENKKDLLNYFKANAKLEKTLQKRGDKDRLNKLKSIEEDYQGITFSAVTQKIPLGDGDAVLRCRAQIKKSPFALMFVDDLFDSKTPPILQLKKVFATSQKSVLGLKRVSAEKVSSYGVVKVEKIAHRLFKIKELTEKPAQNKAPSDLVISGRYILSPDVFNYLEKTPQSKKGEIILAEALRLMLQDGKIIYGYELEGNWLECGKTIDWLKSNLYLTFKHPEYGPILREWLKGIRK